MSNTTDLIFTTWPTSPVDTLNLDDGKLLPERIAICRNALADLVQREDLPISRRGSKLVLDDGDSWRSLTRHEVASLLARAVSFERQVGNTFATRRVDPPAALVAAVLAHPPEALADLGNRPDARTGELWASFLAGWWSSHQDARVSVARLAAEPGIHDLAPILGEGDEHGRRVGLGRLVSERLNIPVEIAPQGEPLTVAPQAAGKERSGSRLYLLDRRGNPITI